MRGNKDLNDDLDRRLGLFKASSTTKQRDASREAILKRLQSQPIFPEAAYDRLQDRSEKSHSRTLRVSYIFAAFPVVVLALISMPILRKMWIEPVVLAQADSSISRISGQNTEVVRAGESIKAGEILRTGDAGGAISIKDGSRAELRSHSELSVERAEDGIRIHLFQGSLIVNAAKQVAGRLYVQTKDVTASVVGTVFLVNAEEAGSRVAVIEGEVHVQQGAASKNLLPGQQVSTNPLMAAPPVVEEIAWSRNARAHLLLLQQSLALMEQAPVVPPPAPQSSTPRETFEVASVRVRGPSAGGGRGAGAPEEPKCYGSVQVDPGRVALTNMMLYRIITIAYGKSCYGFERMKQLSGGPGWVTSDRIDIQATLPAGTPSYTPQQFDPDAPRAESVSAEKLQMMLQNLLADRFKLVLHRETKEVPAYALTIARGGPKLTAWKEGDPKTLGAVTGGLNSRGEWRAIVRAGGLSMAQFSNQLMFVTGRPVLDRTGITGDFNYNLEFTPMDPIAVPRDVPLVSGPSLFTVLEEQLGLKLEAIKAPVDLLVIDHVEKPSEN
jgi:uncharacterized protein (TIGR03435 family)